MTVLARTSSNLPDRLSWDRKIWSWAWGLEPRMTAEEASISLPDQTTLVVKQKKKEVNWTIPRVMKQKRWQISITGPRDNNDCADWGLQQFTRQSWDRKYESWVPRGPKQRMTFGEGQQQFTQTEVSRGQSGPVETSSSQTYYPRWRGGPISKHVKVLERIKVWSWVPTGPETKNDCWQGPAANYCTAWQPWIEQLHDS
jgi:hypothetical protein